MRRLAYLGSGLVIVGGLLLASPARVTAETIDLTKLLLQSTTVRVLDEEIIPLGCTAPVGDPCEAHSALFDPETISVVCNATRARGCTYELTLCLAYELGGTQPIGAVTFTVDGALTDPGPAPGAHVLPRQPLVADTRTCTTVFDSGNARGPHTIGVVVAVENNSAGTATLAVRNATLVIRVYGE